MKPRYNRNSPLFGRHLAVRQNTPRPPKCADLPSRPALPHVAQPSVVVPPSPETPEPPEYELVLEDEISTDELNRFAFCSIELLAGSSKDQPLEQLISQAITENLPSYSILKADLLSSRQEHRNQHAWTKQLVDTVEPLLTSKSAPESERRKLSNLTIHCVEQTMQIQSRVDQLGCRVDFLDQAVTKHLKQVGVEIGLPDALLQKLARLTQSVLEQYTPA